MLASHFRGSFYQFAVQHSLLRSAAASALVSLMGAWWCVQDSHIVKSAFGGEEIGFFGVFDGHGSDGAKVSQHLMHNLPKRLSASEEFQVPHPSCLRIHPFQNICFIAKSMTYRE